MKIRCLYSILILIISSIATIEVKSQTINGVVNSYARVTNITGNQFTIGTPAGKSGASLSDFDAGKKCLFIKPKEQILVLVIILYSDR